MKRLIFILLMVFLGGFSQAQKVNEIKWKYQKGQGDGYDVSVAESYVWDVYLPEEICDGENAMISVQAGGGALFSYKWYEVGKESKVLSTDYFMQLEHCQYATDNGRKFLCKLTDLNSGQVFETPDTIVLHIKKAPVVKLTPAVDTTICYGESISLTVKPVGDAYFYSWEGKGVMGAANSSRVSVQPEENTQYVVTVSDGNCATSVSRTVKVRKVEVKLPQDIIYLGNDGDLTLAPEFASPGGVTNWKVGKTTVTNQEVLKTKLSAITKVQVIRTNARCSATDSCLIMPEIAFGRYVGGDYDGYTESQVHLTGVRVEPKLDSVCRGEIASFGCRVDFMGTIIYQWWKVEADGNDTELVGETDRLLHLQTTDAAAAGKYYCIVKDLDTEEEVKTDVVTLAILETPQISIIAPKTDTTICAGEVVHLKANRNAASNETFRWSGENITSSSTMSREITVAPTTSGTYQLMALRGTCMASREIKINIRNVRVDLPTKQEVLRGESVAFELEKSKTENYTWTANGVKTQGNTFTYTPTKETMVTVVKDAGGCVASDSCLLLVKEFGVGSGDSDKEDGFCESVLPFFIKSVGFDDDKSIVCVGGETTLNIVVSGHDVYEYTWKKILPSGKEVVFDSVSSHLFRPVKSGDAGTYFCEVKDVRSGEVKVSDRVTLKVLEVPDAEIESPANGKWICSSQSIELRAFNAGSNMTYTWEGMNIEGPTDELVATARPQDAATYSLIVSNGTCSAIAYVQINVQHISVDLPEVMETIEGSQLVIKPNTGDAKKPTLTWSWAGADFTAPEFQKTVSESQMVKVKMESEGCEAVDSTRVYVRNTRSFQNGAEDGYIESNSTFRILELKYPKIVCENTDVDFSILVSGSGVYTYSWKQVGKDVTLSEEPVYTIPDCDLSMTDQQYYCEITDLMVGKQLTTDTVTLQVRKGPKAVISYPARGKNYCEGTVIRLDARKTEESKESDQVHFEYAWEGENITETEREWVVDVRPSETQVYTLKVSVDGCVDYDTIKINILQPRIDIPSVVYAKQDEELKVRAQVSNASVNATVNWWHEALFIPNKNPYTTKISESATLIAEVVDQGCMSADTARVYVRTGEYFNGGEDDGFMESCDIPVINADVTTILGCGGVDSVELKVAFTGNPETSKWQKFDETLGEFQDLAAADNLKGLGTPTLTIHPLKQTDYGEYRCILSNDCGSAYSLTYTVANGDVPKLKVHTDTTSFCEGLKDQHIAIALEDKDLSKINFRWYKKNTLTDVLQQFLPEKAYNNPLFTIPEVAAQHDGLYYVEAENACGVTVDSVRLLVIPKVSFLKQPEDTLVCVNTPVTLKVYAQDGGMKACTLKKVELDPSVFEGYRVIKTCSTSGSDRFVFPAVTMDDAGYYVWTVKAECGDSITSQMFEVTVDKPLQFVYQTADTTLCAGCDITLEARAESPDCPESKITYSWEKQGTGKLPYNSSSFEISYSEEAAGNYICSAQNVCGQIGLTNPIQLGMYPNLEITAQPQLESAGICEDKQLELNFTVNAPDFVDSVRWFRRNGAAVEVPVYDSGTRVSGADDYKLTIDSLRLEEAGEYFARAYTVCGLEQTLAVDVKVDEKAKIVKNISDFFPNTEVCQGSEAKLQVEAKGKETLLYSWYINENLVSGANADTLHVRFDSVATYRCIVYNYCAESSSSLSVRIIKSDTFRLRPVGRNHYCEGGDGVRLQLAGSDTASDYRLYKKDADGGDPLLVCELKGKNAAYAGGSLDFGMQPGGVYWVEAYSHKTSCVAPMPGTVTIVMDTLPPLFNTLIEKPICEGETAGNIILDNSVQTLSQIFQYTLHQQQPDGSWKQTGKIQPGTGDTLRWEGVLPGVYKVQTINRETKCTAWMNNEADLQVRPLPTLCDLELLRGDTVYCSEDKVDLALQLNPKCFKDKQTYTLRKDGKLLSDAVITEIPMVWDSLTPGRYSVLVENEWGCSVETNEQHIRMFDVPAKKTVEGDKIYCVGEPAANASTPISISDADPNIRYEFFREGEQKAFDVQYKGASSSIVADVPFKDAIYYVVATDTATGCSTRMKDTVEVKGSRLALSHDPVLMDKSEVEVSLNLTVKDSVGPVKISWTPKELLVDKSDPKHPVVDMTDMSKNIFKATVSDKGCKKEEIIQVSFVGEDLEAHIKDASDCVSDIPNDTIRVCEGAKFSLCASVIGGNGTEYGKRWSQNGNVLGSEISLSDAVAVESGYVVFQVGNGGRVAKDSVWLEMYPAPGKEMICQTPDNLCLAPGENIQLELEHTDTKVEYALEYSKTGEIFKDCGVKANGDASGKLTLKQVFAEKDAGYYRIKATASYGKTVCSAVHDTIEVNRGTLEGLLSGGGDYCQRLPQDTLVLDTTDKAANYRLVYKPENTDEYIEYDNGLPWAGTGDTLLLTGNFPVGTYRVVAERTGGVCVDTMRGEIVIRELEKPGIGRLISDENEYCLRDGQTVDTPISLTECVSTNTYRLYRRTAAATEQVGKDITGQSGDVVLGTSFDKKGLYFAVADNGHCLDTAGYVSINSLPKQELKLVKVDTGYCSGDGDAAVSFKVYPAEPGMHYYVALENSADYVAECTHFVKDTVFFNDRLEAGVYEIKVVLADCEKVLPEKLTVTEYELPEEVALLEPLTACAGTTMDMGVQQSQQGIQYELYYAGDAGIAKQVAEAAGTGKDLVIGQVKEIGLYYVRAEDKKTGCSREMEGYEILPALKSFDLVADDTSYCAYSDESGTQLSLSGTEDGVNYYLQKYDDADGKYKNVGPEASIPGIGGMAKFYFAGIYKAGKYRVVTDVCNGVVIGKELEIIEIALPKNDLAVKISGNACVDSTLQIAVGATENDVVYSLYRNETALNQDLKGNGAEIKWTLKDATEGDYEIRATRNGSQPGGCVAILPNKISVRDLPAILELQGPDKLCEFAVTSLKLQDVEPDVNYLLLNKVSGDTVAVGETSKTAVTFAGIHPGTYYAVAEHGDCRNYSEVKEMPSIKAPEIASVRVGYDACVQQGEGKITLSQMSDTLSYYLTYPDGTEKVEMPKIAGKDKMYDKLDFGSYLLKVQSVKTACYSKTDTLKLKVAVPAGDTLLSNFGYCEGERGALVEISNTTANVQYTISEVGKDETIETVWGGMGQNFTHDYPEGKYVFSAVTQGVYGGCSAVDTFDISKNTPPTLKWKLEIEEQKPFCAGNAYHIKVKDAVEGVSFELRKDEVPVEMIQGKGDIVFSPVSEYGIYTVVPKAGGVCGDTPIDTLFKILKLPKPVYAEQPCFYCNPAGSNQEVGAQLKIYDHAQGVRYILSDGKQKLDTLLGTVSESYLAFKPMAAKVYYIIAEDIETGCSAVVDTAEITKGVSPEVFLCGTDANRCGNVLEVATSDGSEDGVEYHLYRNGEKVSTTAQMTGGKGNVSFGEQTEPGVYQIYATNSAGCGTFMKDSIFVHPDLMKDTISRKGSYCEGGESDIVFRMRKSVPYWRYFIAKGTERSDTLAGTEDGSPLRWSEVGGKDIRSGVYTLYALNPCGDTTKMDTIKIDTNKQPAKQDIVEGDFVICEGDSCSITLKSSEQGVSYDLMYKGEAGEKLLATVDGTGAALPMGFASKAGDYTVIGRMQATGCLDTIDRIKVTSISGIEDPGVIAADICLGPDATPLTVKLTRKFNEVSYYLEHLTQKDTVRVDSIKFGKAGDADRMDFAAQNDAGSYRVVAQGPTCKKIYNAAKIGKPAVEQEIFPTGPGAVCDGSTVNIGLKQSEWGVNYEVYEIVTEGLDTKVTSIGLVAEGTGKALTLGALSQPGTYIIKAHNGCTNQMKGEYKLQVNTAYKIELREEYSVCEKDDSVQIEILGRTNPAPNAKYRIYPPGTDIKGQDYAEEITSGSAQASVLSSKYYSKPGFYRVVGLDANGCPEQDSVKIVSVAMPEVYSLGIRGNQYLCTGESKKVLYLDGAQTDVEYHLFRAEGKDWTEVTMVAGKEADAEILFEVFKPGTYKVKAEYNNEDRHSCPIWMKGEVTLSEKGVQQYKIEALVDTYCDRPDTKVKGQLQLAKSELGVSYQLYKDGSAYGEPRKATKAGDPIRWSDLPGGVPKMSASQEAAPAVYTVVATDLASSCQANMLGEVPIIGERTIQFNDNHLADELPKCVGEQLKIEVIAYGGEITYQWMKDGKPVDGERQYVFVREHMKDSDVGSYHCVMENTCGKDSTRRLNVIPSLLVEREKGPRDTVSVCDLAEQEVRSVRLLSSVLNASKWEWYKDQKLITSGREQWLDVQVSKAKGSGVYVCKASNNCGSLWDTCVVLVDSTPHMQLVAPAAIDTLCQGVEYKLEVKSNYPISWLLGNKAVGTGNTLTVKDIAPESAGFYYAQSKNGCGEKKLLAGTLVVDQPIKVISKQTTFRVCRQSGDIPLLFVQTTPKERVSYYWEDQKGKVLSRTNELADIDLNEYNGLTEIFTVHYQNKCTSGEQEMKMLISDRIEFKEPVDEIKVCVSDKLKDTVLRVVPAEPEDVTYKWYYMPREETVESARDSVGNLDSLRIGLSSTANAGFYYCYLANMCTDTVSHLVSVRVDTVPDLISNIKPKETLCAGTELNLSIKGKGGSLTYVWKVKKQGGKVEKVSAETHFGESESHYKVTVDTTYNKALIWCDISNSCSTRTSDTLHLSVLPAPAIKMTPDFVDGCEGSEKKICITLEKGVQPWSYKYSVDGQEQPEIHKVAEKTDTLKVSEGGIYRIFWLKDDTKCEAKGTELAVAEYHTYEVSEVSMTAEHYVGPVCPGEEVTLKVVIGGTVKGPWNLEIRRKSDGQLASELGFDAPIYTFDTVYSCKFKLQKTEEYFARVTNVLPGGTECEAKSLTKPVKLEVHENPKISSNTLTPEQRIFGRCATVDLDKLFNVQPHDGWYLVNGKELNGGDWLLETEDHYKIGYRLYKEGCVYEYDLDQLEFKPLPKVSMEVVNKILCHDFSGSQVNINAVGEYPIKVSYRIANLKENGTAQLVTTVPDYELTEKKPSLSLSVGKEDPFAGKIYEITRVEDRFKCTVDDLTPYVDTVYFMKEPLFKVFSKRSNSTDWRFEEISTYQIRREDSVDVKIELQQGMKPWTAVFNPNPGPAAGFKMEQLTASSCDTALYEPGVYWITVEDKYCSAESFDYKPKIWIKTIDTAYIQVKAYLQGPWNDAAGKMESAVLDKIGMRDLKAWPNVGSRKIIDWIEVELWTEQETLWDTQACLLLSDGTVVDKTGSETLKMIGKGGGKYHVALRPRNHLPVWFDEMDLSSTKASAPMTFDFTNPSRIYRKNGESVSSHVFVNTSGKAFLYAGDANIDRLISSFDPNRITKELLSLDLLKAEGELLLDVNYNGQVEWPGYKVDGMDGVVKKEDDWILMYLNREKYTLVPTRAIKW